jgi:iron complex outermembrane receptor protein
MKQNLKESLMSYCSTIVNRIFEYKYISNRYFYTYDDDFSNPPAVTTTIEGAGYYPQAGINFL